MKKMDPCFARHHVFRGFPAREESSVSAHFPDFSEHPLSRISDREIDVTADIEDADVDGAEVSLNLRKHLFGRFFLAGIPSVASGKTTFRLDLGDQGRKHFAAPATHRDVVTALGEALGDGRANVVTGADDQAYGFAHVMFP